MQNNESDIFESSQKKYIPNDGNFFLNGEDKSIQKPPSFDVPKRVNDYDYNLLKESAYKDIGDDLLKLEYKINKAEEELKSLDSQIKSAEEIKDFKLIESLLQRKSTVKENYMVMRQIYKDKSFSAKLTESFTNKIAKIIGAREIVKKLSAINESIVSILPSNIVSIIRFKKAMSKLENINKSVDELMKLNIPYGENSERYRQLSSYIAKANSIQSEISGLVKKK